MFYKAIKKTDKARMYFYDAVKIGLSLMPKNVTESTWFKKAQMWLDEIRRQDELAESEEQRKEKEPFLKEMEGTLNEIEQAS